MIYTEYVRYFKSCESWFVFSKSFVYKFQNTFIKVLAEFSNKYDVDWGNKTWDFE